MLQPSSAVAILAQGLSRMWRVSSKRLEPLGLFSILLLGAGVEPQPSRQSTPAARDSIVARPVLAPAYVVMDVDTGRVLASRNMKQRKFPASTTKVMTALLALEQSNLNSIVTIGPNPPKIGGSSIYVQQGETFTMQHLVQAALIRSANDSCLAIAETVAGSEAEFVKRMNRKAKELGAVDTNFVNPHGLHHPDHVSTVYDLAVIARAAMKHPEFNAMVATRTATIPGNEKIGALRTLHNRNRLLFRWNESDGVKTGYTRQAGRCLIASATRIDPATNRPWRLLSVVLQSPDSWSDSANLLVREGFEKYSPTVIAGGGETLAKVPVEGGARVVQATAAHEIRLPLLPSESGALTSKIHPLERAAPIAKGQTIAWLEWRLNGRKIAAVPLVARDAVEKSLVARLVPAAAPLVPSQPLLRWSITALVTAGILFLLAGWKVRIEETKRQERYRRAGRIPAHNRAATRHRSRAARQSSLSESRGEHSSG